ncbi:hypothetical protein MBLNU230_g3410t1 [Neophaeotheca triangularis]
MKGSTANSFKSWVSKIHPQLPLTRIESQRLLTALTSSFRRHLDQVHPTPAQANTRPKKETSESPSQSSIQSLHSSAAYADKHLASVLTSPLLARQSSRRAPAPSAVLRKLYSRPNEDPIELLEDYERRGLATVEVAEACLKVYFEKLRSLNLEAQQELIRDRKAGLRTLNWLWNSKWHHSVEFVCNRLFIACLVQLLYREGAEKWVWEWLKTNDAISNDIDFRPDGWADAHNFGLRWKSYLVRYLVFAGLDDPAQRSKRSADTALDIYFKARELLKAAPSGVNVDGRNTQTDHLGLARMVLKAQLTRFHDVYARTDPARYDRFMHTWVEGREEKQPWAQYGTVGLKLFHPTRPETAPFLEFAESFWSKDANVKDRHAEKNIQAAYSKYYMAIWALHLLKGKGDPKAYGSLYDTLQSNSTQLAVDADADLQRLGEGLTLATPEAMEKTDLLREPSLLCPPMSV